LPKSHFRMFFSTLMTQVLSKPLSFYGKFKKSTAESLILRQKLHSDEHCSIHTHVMPLIGSYFRVKIQTVQQPIRGATGISVNLRH